jgi:RimJ/RimL family protein N-acetyltransferase
MNEFRPVMLDPVRPTNLWAYNSIWRSLRRETGYRLRFGNAASPAVCGRPWDVFQVGNWRKFLIALEGGERIGVASVLLDKPNACCSIELGLLPQYRNQRFGSTAGRLLIRKCFVEFSARRVEGSALSTNPASVQMRDWMSHEGTMHSRFLIDGQEVHELIFGITRARWEFIEQRLVLANLRDPAAARTSAPPRREEK